MKRNHKIIAGLLVAAGISGLAFAQPGMGGYGCDGMGPMAGQGGPMGRQAGMKFDPGQRAERHLGFLKSELKITADQEPLWLAFADKMKVEAGKGFAAMRTQAADEKLTAPERMEKRQALMQERLEAMKGVHESFNRLYTALTPEQKAIADQHAVRMGNWGGKAGRMGPGRMAPPTQPAPQS
jgi:Spy/CpxP family protein refolding chaperone